MAKKRKHQKKARFPQPPKPAPELTTQPLRAEKPWDHVRQHLWGWPVISVISAISLGFAGNAIYGHDITVACVTLLIGISLLAIKFVIWDKTENLPHRDEVNVSVVVLAVLAFTICVSFAMQMIAGRHLTEKQIEGLGKLADALPPDIGVLVRFPPNSEESRAYAIEFWQILHDHNVKCGAPIIAGVEQPSPGLHVFVRSLFDPAGQPAETFMSGMEGLGLHPFWGENYPWADPKIFILYVGPKESYD